MIDAAGNWQDDVNHDDEREAQALKRQVANQSATAAPRLDASTLPALPVAQTPPALGASTGQITPPQPAQPATPGPTGPAIPTAPATTTDPLAFTPSQATLTPPPAAPVANSFDPVLNANGTYTTAANAPTAGLFGGDEAKKAEYWAKQGASVSGAGAVPYMAGTTQAQQDKGVADYTAKLRGGTDSDVAALLAAAQAGTQNINPAQEAQTGAFNAQTTAQDRARGVASIEAGDGVRRGKFADNLTPGVSVGTPGYYDGMQNRDGTAPSGAIVPPPSPPIDLPGNGTSARPALPTGPANDVGPGGPTTGGTLPGPITADPIEQAIAAATSNTAGPSTTTTSNGASTLTPVTPDTALTNYRISAGPQTDRFKIAQDRYDAARAASEGGYTADLREANEGAFGAGRGVSGMLRTRRGNIASDRQATLAKTQSDFLSDALEGSIGDAYRNIGIDERQQGFEKSQQDTAFGQGLSLAELEDRRQRTGFDQNKAIQELSNAQTDQEFRQAMQRLLIGSEGDPAKMQLLLTQIFGGQSAQSADAARRLAET